MVWRLKGKSVQLLANYNISDLTLAEHPTAAGEKV